MITLVEPVRKRGRWWPCWCQKCFPYLWRLEKNWTLGEMHTSLGKCPQLLFRYKWKNLDTLPFFFDVLAKLTARLVGMSFFQLCVRFLFWSFLVRSVTEKFAFVFQNWFHLESIVCGVFSSNVPRFVVVISAWARNCQSSSIVFFFGRHQVTLMNIIRDVLICSSNVTVLFRHCSL